MFLSLLTFALVTIFLFLSSQTLISRLCHFLPLNLLFFILLPGILLHELSHILTAELLQVRTGQLNLRPSLKDNHLQLGSAQIAQTDPFRLTLIGTAPFLTGSLSLWLILRLGLQFNFSLSILSNFQHLSALSPLIIFLFCYLLFTISNTMFSSPSDLQAGAVPLILVLIILGSFQLTHLQLPASLPIYLTNFFFLLATVFFFTLILNLILLLPLNLLRLNHGQPEKSHHSY
ncbi:MAG: hypothetical protein V1810_00875 [Candidatus Beckwithbacteria bacterium]